VSLDVKKVLGKRIIGHYYTQHNCDNHHTFVLEDQTKIIFDYEDSEGMVTIK